LYKQILTNAKLNTGKGDQKTELIGRSQFRRRRSALDCSAIEEEEEEERGDLRLGRGNINSAVHATSLTVQLTV
jgi:hypothetical protein